MRRDGGAASRRIAWVIVAGLLAGAVLVWLTHPWVRTVEIFFVRVDSTGHRAALVPVHRPAPAREAEARLRIALGALLAGPSSEEKSRGIVSEIPRGTGLHGVRIEDGVAIVDLTTDFARGGGSTSMQARVWQIVYTATQFRDAPAAQILLEGRRVDALGGEGLVIGQALRRPELPPTF